MSDLCWDNRNRMTESRTATNALLGTYIYNERGLRIKAERSGQPIVQVVAPNGGERKIKRCRYQDFRGNA